VTPDRWGRRLESDRQTVMLNIGLTGGIGSGKSTVAAYLQKLGAPVIDADKVGHEIYLPGTPAYEEVVAEFGRGILAPDGTIDRQRLGAIVFADRAALKRLEAIVQPRIFEEVLARIAKMRADGVTIPIVVEAAIMLEARWGGTFDQIWLVVAPREQVVGRIQLQRGLNPQQIEARIQSQMSEEERRKRATVVIENNGTLEELFTKVRALWDALNARDAH
jgi:dephospho-CoA kinase